MIGRRGMLAGMVYGAGGLGQPRRDQEHRPGPDRVIAPGGAAGIFRGRLVIVFGPSGAVNGVFVYAPGTTPGLGNPPIASMTGGSFDPFGNVVQSSITSYSSGANRFIQMALNQLLINPGVTGFTSLPSVGAQTGISGAALQLSSGQKNAGDAVSLLTLFDAAASSPGAATAVFGRSFAQPVTTAVVEVQGDAALAYPSGLTGRVPATQADHTLITVTAAVATRITKAWSIPANDAKVDTCYRLTAWGFGTEGTTAQNCQFGIGLNGAVVRSMTATALTISGNLRWKVEIILHILTTGAGGTADVAMNGDWGTAATPAVTGPIVAASTASGGEPVNTTANNDLELMIAWASATGAPTLTCVGSIFERIGP